MNDRFKFRVWFNSIKRYSRNTDNLCLGEDGSLGSFDSYGCYSEDAYTIEQCTGLRDKNRKLIYEGDILGYKDYADKRVVVWDNKYMAYRVHDEDNVDCGSVYQEYIGEFGIEVIGNIHENPELLKESK